MTLSNALRRFLGLATAGEAPRIPDGRRVYVIGDVHGRADLLRSIRALIADDCANTTKIFSETVFLGDYVDRGPDTRDVLSILADEPFSTKTVFLKGNHEAMMLAFLANPEADTGWLFNGGIETLRSYGIAIGDLRETQSVFEASQRLGEILPHSHEAFLRKLKVTHGVGDYFFCHAGVRPGIPLERQAEADLLWIREPFLSSNAAFGKVVVHGHTPVQEPELRANRINIDTGAYISGRLSCLVLEGETCRLLVADARRG